MANGVYKENLVINQEIALIGSSMDSTVIDGSTSSYYNVVEFSKDGSMNNFTIKGKIDASYSACVVTLFNNVYISHCKISDATEGIFYGNSSAEVSYVIIENVQLAFRSDCSSDTCRPSLTNSIILYNGNDFHAVKLPFGGNPNIENNIIVNFDNNSNTYGIGTDYT